VGTFCADLGDDDGGRCVPRVAATHFECRPFDHLQPQTAHRPTQQGVTANVCLPGTRGFIGDRCTATDGCQAGLTCRSLGTGSPTVCTQACTSTCPDQRGVTETLCADAGDGQPGNECVRSCDPVANSGECAAGFECAPVDAAGGASRFACVAAGAAQQ
jgi:hypothetical protein